MQAKNKKKVNVLGERLKAFRQRLRLNQSELASQLNFSSPTVVSRFERGERLPSTETLMKLAELYEIDLHWLLTGQPAPTAQEAAKERQDAINKLARYVSSKVAHLLKNRDDIAAELKRVEERKRAGDAVEDVLIEIWKTQLRIAEYRLQEVSKDQNWVRLALADTVGKGTE